MKYNNLILLWRRNLSVNSDKYIKEHELCRNNWCLIDFDNTECELFGKKKIISDTVKLDASLSPQQNIRMEHTCLSGIKVSETGVGHMLNIAKWARFLAIVAAIGLALLTATMVFGIIAMITKGDAKGPTIAIYIFIIIVIYFFPVKKTFELARHMKVSALQCDSRELEYGLDDLRSILKFMGVLTIIMLAFYAMVFIIFIFVGISTAILSINK